MMVSRHARPSPIKNILTVDVEDYFQVEAFSSTVLRASWDEYPSRVVDNCQRLLDLFDFHGARGTFFVLGWIAQRHPRLVREIHQRGHELGCHSFWHHRISSLTPQQFRTDTRNAQTAIRDAASADVLGYRAPTWSITSASMWALDILAEEGFLYDSSIFPVRHDLYGIPNAGRHMYFHHCRNGKRLIEFPPATVKFGGVNLPAGGGGYFRIFPLAYTRWAFRTFQEEQHPFVFYIHPWEIDPGQPRLHGPLKSRFRHYSNLDKTLGRLNSILSEYSFESFRDHLAREGALGVAAGNTLSNVSCG